jgi:hypothetical protein
MTLCDSARARSTSRRARTAQPRSRAWKGLTEIEVVDGTFTGHFQTASYFYERERDGKVVREQVTLQRLRALITEPKPGDEIEPGDLAIRGVAWSGAAPSLASKSAWAVALGRTPS